MEAAVTEAGHTLPCGQDAALSHARAAPPAALGWALRRAMWRRTYPQQTNHRHAQQTPDQYLWRNWRQRRETWDLAVLDLAALPVSAVVPHLRLWCIDLVHDFLTLSSPLVVLLPETGHHAPVSVTLSRDCLPTHAHTCACTNVSGFARCAPVHALESRPLAFLLRRSARGFSHL